MHINITVLYILHARNSCLYTEVKSFSDKCVVLLQVNIRTSMLVQYHDTSAINSIEQNIIEKLIVAQLLRMFPVVHGIRRFIIGSAKAQHWSLF
jgi:hypothetical protein